MDAEFCIRWTEMGKMPLKLPIVNAWVVFHGGTEKSKCEIINYRPHYVKGMIQRWRFYFVANPICISK